MAKNKADQSNKDRAKATAQRAKTEAAAKRQEEQSAQKENDKQMRSLAGNHDNLYPYPDEFPSEAIGIFIDLVRQEQGADLQEGIHAGWVVLGYGAGLMDNDTQPAFTSGAGGGPPVAEWKGKRLDTTEKLCTALEQMCDEETNRDTDEETTGETSDTPKRVGAQAFPWKVILPMLFQVLSRLLESQLRDQQARQSRDARVASRAQASSPEDEEDATDENAGQVNRESGGAVPRTPMQAKRMDEVTENQASNASKGIPAPGTTVPNEPRSTTLTKKNGK